MDMQSSLGGLIPLWILAAPLVVGLIAWMTGPKVITRHDDDLRTVYPGVVHTGSVYR